MKQHEKVKQTAKTACPVLFGSLGEGGVGLPYVVWVMWGKGVGLPCVVWVIEGMGAEGVGWLVLCCLRMTLKEGWSVWAHRYEEQITLKAIAPYPDNE